MAGAPAAHFAENSPEEVAYKLLRLIAFVENKRVTAPGIGDGTEPADRKWVLDTYAECLDATKDRRSFPKQE